MKKNLLIIGSLSILNAVWMIFISHWLISVLPFLHSEEMLLFKMASFVKTLVLEQEEKPSKDDFIFINTAYDKQLVNIYDEKTGPGNRAITDRKKLAEFFKILNQKPDNHKYVICDILFKDTSDFDTLLEKELKRLPNVIIAYDLDENGNPDIITPFAKLNKGLATYRPEEGVLLRFNLQDNDIHKSLPLVMYEQLHHTKLKHKGFLYWLNDHIIFHNFILNLRIRDYDLFERKEEERYQIVNLGYLLGSPGPNLEESILSYVKNKIIIIGDFVEQDIHATIYGDMAGSLILLNAYLALVNKDNVITIPFLLFLFLSYSLLFFVIFYWDLTRFYPAIKIPILFMIISVTSYFFFNIYINILHLSMWMGVLVWIRNFSEKNYRIKKLMV